MAKRDACPAWNLQCYICQTFGHFQKFCRNSRTPFKGQTSQISSLNASAPFCLRNSTILVSAGQKEFRALVDSGASESFVKSTVVQDLNLSLSGPESTIKLASNKSFAKILGRVNIKLKISDKEYKIRMVVIDDLCADFVLGIDFMKLHQQVIFQDNGESEPFTVCSLAVSNVEDPPRIFQFLHPRCKPIASPSRRFSKYDNAFICSEVKKLLEQGIV